MHEAGGVKCEGPEYETIALCGANCGVGDIEALMRFNHECDEWGLDTISSGSVVGLAMDLTEKGIADFGLRFGEAEGYRGGAGSHRPAGRGRAPTWPWEPGPWPPSTGSPSWAWRSRTWSFPATTRGAPSA